MSWLDQLRKRNEDRGLMASLRCSLVESKKHRAWPALNRLGIDVADHVGATVSGLYATHPEEIRTGNLGSMCNAIERSRGENGAKDKETKLTPTERRFQHLLAAESEDELLGRVVRMVLLAKAQRVPVNFAQLETDLRRWNQPTQMENVRLKWAASFWIPEGDSDRESIDAGGVL
jgi:CRISPR system Cascade subunit CasB